MTNEFFVCVCSVRNEIILIFISLRTVLKLTSQCARLFQIHAYSRHEYICPQTEKLWWWLTIPSSLSFLYTLHTIVFLLCISEHILPSIRQRYVNTTLLLLTKRAYGSTLSQGLTCYLIWLLYKWRKSTGLCIRSNKITVTREPRLIYT